MPKKSTPSFVLEFPLATSLSDEARLNSGMFEAGKRLRNTLLQEGLRIVDAIRCDPAWDAARKMPKANDLCKKVRGAEFQSIRKAHGFTDYAFQSSVLVHRSAGGFSGRIGSAVTQKLATTVFRSLARYLLGLNGRPRFKGVKRPLHSLEGKTNQANLRWDTQTKSLSFGVDWTIAGVMPNLSKDESGWKKRSATSRRESRTVWGESVLCSQHIGLNALATHPMLGSLNVTLANKLGHLYAELGITDLPSQTDHIGLDPFPRTHLDSWV